MHSPHCKKASVHAKLKMLSSLQINEIIKAKKSPVGKLTPGFYSRNVFNKSQVKPTASEKTASNDKTFSPLQ